LWILIGGVLAGLAAAVFLTGRKRRERTPRSPDLRALEDAVIRALRHDPSVRGRGIDVAAIAPGIIELTGLVESEAEGQHAVDVAHNVIGVRTVLNRLDAREVSQRMRPRSALKGGSRWYGMSVGMGRRRQSRQTDPARRDDHADLVEEALAPNVDEAVTEVAQERMEKRATPANEIS
jgi:hypothetical protein